MYLKRVLVGACRTVGNHFSGSDFTALENLNVLYVPGVCFACSSEVWGREELSAECISATRYVPPSLCPLLQGFEFEGRTV